MPTSFRGFDDLRSELVGDSGEILGAESDLRLVCTDQCAIGLKYGLDILADRRAIAQLFHEIKFDLGRKCPNLVRASTLIGERHIVSPKASAKPGLNVARGDPGRIGRKWCNCAERIGHVDGRECALDEGHWHPDKSRHLE